ncbi:GTPase Era [Helicobacter sp. 10-6591]|nr:GTPase Era [Helicobacter sp. 10-6591]
MLERVTRCGFVSVIGRPNAGKSTLLNALAGQNLSLVSNKANATRKQLQVIIGHSIVEGSRAYDVQIVFVDTPGLHYQEKLLNKFMLNEALRALNDCDLHLYLAAANDDISHYEKFLRLLQEKQEERKKKIEHILVLSKCDILDRAQLLEQIGLYKKFVSHFLALIPLSVKKNFKPKILLDCIARFLPNGVFLYDEQMATNAQTREIVKELIRESLFENLSDEVPYESDVIIDSYTEGSVERICARILTLKNSQKPLIIGSNGRTIKRIGICARQKIENLLGKKVFLKLEVVVEKAWNKEISKLKKMGYDFRSTL